MENMMALLADKVRYLSNPSNYPYRPARVVPIETHMAWVFLAGDRVYKFKKPVRFDFLDMTTLASREHRCREELRLNKRLAGDTYIRVIPLTEHNNGELQFEGEGEVVEYVLEMRRLPAALMLDAHIRDGFTHRRDVEAVAKRLAAFYQNADAVIEDGHFYLGHIQLEMANNRSLLLGKRLEVTLPNAGQHLDALDETFLKVRPEIEDRIAGGHIVEGHGDLRPEHICLTDPPLIIDCLEFDRSMRILDPYDEVNYLGLECNLLGLRWARAMLLEELDQTLEARPSDALMAFYSEFRKLLRARICLAHLLDPVPMTPALWPGRASAYLALDATHPFKAPPPSFRSVIDAVRERKPANTDR